MVPEKFYLWFPNHLVMKLRHPIVLVSIFFSIVVAACSILKKEDSEKDIKVFLTTFQGSLASSDDEILRHFESRQTKEAILAAVRILQNKEHAFIECIAAFNDASITIEEYGVKVVVPITVKTKEIDNALEEKSALTLILRAKDENFVITELQGEEFYQTFAGIRNTIEWSVERLTELRKRQPIYELARVLQAKFDSVVWYTTYQDKKYFYAVNGKWVGYTNRFEKRHNEHDCKMGLIDDEGNVVIPVEYDLIGSIGFPFADLVEVKKDGKVGYFDIARGQLLQEPVYDMVIPYQKGSAFAITRQDTLYGWIDRSFHYNEGFPSPEAADWVLSYEFLPTNLRLKADSTIAFAEIPHIEWAGFGIVVPPSYLVKTGIFNEVITGISTTAIPISGWTDYVETGATMLEAVTDKIYAVMTSITERYIDGREEFYTYNRLTFVNEKRDTLAVSDLSNDGEVKFRQISSTLLEVKFDVNRYEGSDLAESNIPEYIYYFLGENLSVEKLPSRRTFAFTQFVKIDSTYLTGDFNTWNSETQLEDKTTFLSLATLNYMRNEILASYNYRFTDEAGQNQFRYADWYTPLYDTVEEIHGQMTEIDRYNLAFLDKVMALMTDKPV